MQSYPHAGKRLPVGKQDILLHQLWKKIFLIIWVSNEICLVDVYYFFQKKWKAPVAVKYIVVNWTGFGFRFLLWPLLTLQIVQLRTETEQKLWKRVWKASHHVSTELTSPGGWESFSPVRLSCPSCHWKNTPPAIVMTFWWIAEWLELSEAERKGRDKNSLPVACGTNAFCTNVMSRVISGLFPWKWKDENTRSLPCGKSSRQRAEIAFADFENKNANPLAKQ